MDFSTFNINMNTGCCKYDLKFELSDVPFDEKVVPTPTNPVVLTHSSTGSVEKITAPDNTETTYDFYIRYSSTFDTTSANPLDTNCIYLLGTPTGDVQFF